MEDEIQRIISGESQVEHGTVIQTIIGHLRRSQETSAVDKESKQFQREEENCLRKFIEENELWVLDIDLSNYISEGAEQKVYLKNGKK
jgi:Serine/Threonine/Tyrosine Kinase found in polyvalent proteins